MYPASQITEDRPFFERGPEWASTLRESACHVDPTFSNAHRVMGDRLVLGHSNFAVDRSDSGLPEGEGFIIT